MEKYVCDKCGYAYDSSVGDPSGGVAAGTPFESIPDSWICPMCKEVSKGSFYKATETEEV